MTIIDALLANLTHRNEPVRDVCVGAFWTLVQTRFAGLSTTYRDLDLQHSDTPKMVPRAGALCELTAGQLAEYARSDETVSASIGMATINSLLEVDESVCEELNAFDILLEKGRGRKMCVVGHFPFIPKLRETAQQLWVLEKRLRPGDLPSDEATSILPQCEVVCLTSSSLVNHTADALLALCKDAYVVLTGPTSPMTPLLFDFGIDVICGSRVPDPEQVKRYLSQAATFRQIKGHGVRLLAMRASR